MSLDKTKTDPALGKKIHALLETHNVETPTISGMSNNAQSEIEENFRKIMESLGLDLADDSLRDTPSRVAKMYVDEIFWGLDYNNFPKCTTVENTMRYNEMVVERGVNVQSQCEHHWQSISGKAIVGYLPKTKVLGLSKINRIVEYFSRRPQIQERLTEQIYYALCSILGTKDVAVIIEADHFCVKARGVEDTGSNTITSKLGGAFIDKNLPEIRAEFMGFFNRK